MTKCSSRTRSGTVLVAAVAALVATACGMSHSAMLDRAAEDLSCPREQLESRCVVGTHGSWAVSGCGRYAEYTQTTAGPQIRAIGNGRPPNEEWLCARGP